MDQGQYIFSQIMNFLPKKKFDRCVDLYGGNYRMRSFEVDAGNEKLLVRNSKRFSFASS